MTVIYIPLNSRGHYAEVTLKKSNVTTTRIVYAENPDDVRKGGTTPVYKDEYWSYLNTQPFFDALASAQQSDFGLWAADEDY